MGKEHHHLFCLESSLIALLNYLLPCSAAGQNDSTLPNSPRPLRRATCQAGNEFGRLAWFSSSAVRWPSSLYYRANLLSEAERSRSVASVTSPGAHFMWMIGIDQSR
jgi:hypothetical protein